MIENAGSTRIADARGGHVGFLNHRSDQTARLCYIVGDDCFAKSDIRKHPIQRIERMMIGSSGEKVRGGPRPKFRSCNSQSFLATEAVEECPLGYRSRLAKIINAGRGEAFGANNLPCSFQEPGSSITPLGCMFGWSRHTTIYTVRSVCVNDEAPIRWGRIALKTRDAI